MKTKHLNLRSGDGDTFDNIIEDIKQRNLSKDNMPKLIIGTGLSITYGIPGMGKLAEYLDKEIAKSKNGKLRGMWKKRLGTIKSKGLEAGLANLARDEDVLVDRIKVLTVKFILDSEEKLLKDIWKRDTGFSKLMVYLSGTASVNNKVIDIMTPNYDRVIETVCDRLNIGVITGFQGGLYQWYNRNLLKHPTDFYNCKKYPWVRLFKPHGSINWVREGEDRKSVV